MALSHQPPQWIENTVAIQKPDGKWTKGFQALQIGDQIEINETMELTKPRSMMKWLFERKSTRAHYTIYEQLGREGAQGITYLAKRTPVVITPPQESSTKNQLLEWLLENAADGFIETNELENSSIMRSTLKHKLQGWVRDVIATAKIDPIDTREFAIKQMIPAKQDESGDFSGNCANNSVALGGWTNMRKYMIDSRSDDITDRNIEQVLDAVYNDEINNVTYPLPERICIDFFLREVYFTYIAAKLRIGPKIYGFNLERYCIVTERLDKTLADAVPGEGTIPSINKITHRMQLIQQLLYINNIEHGDQHVNNYMFNASGRLYLIDWGVATYLKPNHRLLILGRPINQSLKKYLVKHKYKIPKDCTCESLLWRHFLIT